MGECTVVLVGGNNGGKEHLLQELLGRRQGGCLVLFVPAYYL